MKNLIHQNRVTILEIMARFYVQKLLNFLPTKSCHDCKNRVTILTASGPEISFSESAFSTISRVKFKPLIHFQCYFRLRAPDP